MPIIRRWSASAQTPLGNIAVTFECPFFNELLENETEIGRLPVHFEAHALWDYFGTALKAYDMAQKNIVDEEDLSRRFDVEVARQLFRSTANKHGVKPQKMVRFWDAVHRQRIALHGKDQLPEQFCFRYWGN